MASGTAVRPKSSTHELSGTAGLGRMPDRDDQVAAKNPRHYRTLYALYLETKLRKLRQHVLAFHDAQMGKKSRANDGAATQRITKGIKIAQRQFGAFHAPDEIMVGQRIEIRKRLNVRFRGFPFE